MSGHRRARFGCACALAIAASLANACALTTREGVPPSTAGAPAVASTRATRPRAVLVTIVVDQLAAWIAEERWPLLPEHGGFRRLAREGTWVHALEYAHAVTDTAPGHAALYTGAVPRASGIFGNELVDAHGDVVSILRDERTRIIAPDVASGVSSSPARLMAPTIADRLRDARPDAVTLGLSIKDRGAILPVGQRPTAAVWLDVKEARFVTSSAYTTALPPWVERHGSRAAVTSALASPWTRTWTTAPVRVPDDQAGEGDESGLGRTFPHAISGSRAPGRIFRTTPAADDTLLAMALDALPFASSTASGSGDAPLLLELSLSANDYIGHVFGPDSWEAWDELARLDASLARFFAALDERFGPTGWMAMLSADHGTFSMPEVATVPGAHAWCNGGRADPWERPCAAGHRIDLEELTTALRDAAQRALPARSDLVRGVADPYVFVGEGARALDGGERAKLDGALRAALERTPGVRRVYAVDELPADCPPLQGDAALSEDARIAALVCRSVMPKRGEHAGGYYVVTTPGSFFDARIVRGFGTSHGTPYRYDRTVPLLVRAPGKVRAGAAVREPVDFRAFARTAAALLDISPPSAAASGRDLTR